MESIYARDAVAVVIYYVVGLRPACDSIRSQNHRVVTEGAGELQDG